MSDLRSKLIRLAHAHPELRADLLPILKEAREAIPVGTGGETQHLRYHRYSGSVRITDLANAGRRGKKVDILTVWDLDYLRNDLAIARLNRWLEGVVKGNTFDQVLRDLKALFADFERGLHDGYMPKWQVKQEKGVRIDPPQSVSKKIKDLKVLDIPEKTITVNAKPSDVSIRQVVFFLQDDGSRGYYMSDDVVSNTRNRRETKALYQWVVQNIDKLKRVKTLSDVYRMLESEGVPYRSFSLD